MGKPVDTLEISASEVMVRFVREDGEISYVPVDALLNQLFVANFALEDRIKVLEQKLLEKKEESRIIKL